MSSFRGNYDNSVDPKGRVSIPAKFRKALTPQADATFVIVRGPGKCLRAYPQDIWEVYEAELAARPESEEVLGLKRLLFNTLSDSVLDGQGRITLTTEQMKIAGITKGVTLVGSVSYIELWDTGKYREKIAGEDDNFDDVFFKSVGPAPVE